METVEAIRYKLINFGIPIDEPAEVLCDNKQVVKNFNTPSSTLNKRNNTTFYHRVRKAQAANIIWVGWIEGIRKLADFFTGYIFKYIL